jgi:hypothetical protein
MKKGMSRSPCLESYDAEGVRSEVVAKTDFPCDGVVEFNLIT